MRIGDDELRALVGRVKDDWREGEKFSSIISDGETGWDDDGNVEAYSGHMVCESVKSPMIRALICRTPTLAAEVLELRAEVARLKAEIEREDKSHERTIIQRDRAEDMLDKLAQAIGGYAIGDHSSANCPWKNALERQGNLQAALTAARENADRLAMALTNLSMRGPNPDMVRVVTSALAAHMKMRRK